MPIWRVTPVTEMPTSTLAAWRVIQTETGERHLCGYAPREREGRVTSAIATFDPATASAITSTGRAYRLTGRPGRDADAAYVLGHWLAMNRVQSIEDVTEEVWAAIKAAGEDAQGAPKVPASAGREAP
jgi:hypothetical protein